jgi:hypothetical protein
VEEKCQHLQQTVNKNKIETDNKINTLDRTLKAITEQTDIFRILLFLLITQTPRTNNQPAV